MPNRPSDGTRINEMIRIPEVLVIGADGSQVGVVDTRRAMQIAKDVGLDLVEVSPMAKPPVCRIMDYGKYRFEQAKKTKAAKQKQHIVKIKEIKFHPKTATNDYNYRVKQAREFLEGGMKVRLLVQFRGREMAHTEYGKRLLDQAKLDLLEVGDIEMESRVEGNTMSTIFNPRKTPPKKHETGVESEPTAAS
ncbi:MAG TPA: translation initiation factor IF-3 [Fibrobacteraceae bacterium]|nr:translation initiation factor IF-3 [Fibrobacteraceae bacterium]